MVHNGLSHAFYESGGFVMDSARRFSRLERSHDAELSALFGVSGVAGKALERHLVGQGWQVSGWRAVHQMISAVFAPSPPICSTRSRCIGAAGSSADEVGKGAKELMHKAG